jgi:hypothetical protein
MQSACHASFPLRRVPWSSIFNNLGLPGFSLRSAFHLSSAQKLYQPETISDIAASGSDRLFDRDFSLTQNEITHRVQLFNNLRLSLVGKAPVAANPGSKRNPGGMYGIRTDSEDAAGT